MPLAAALLKSRLDSIADISSRLDTVLCDFFIDDSAGSITDKVLKEAPDLAGFSIYLWNRDLAEQVCRMVKESHPGIILFAGGAEATALPRCLLNSAPFDFVIKGEGELSLSEAVKRLLNNRPYSDIDGIHTADNTNTPNRDQWPVPDLEAIPSPFLTGVLDLKKYSGVLWELSRGCPFRCSFCFESRGVEGVRQYPLDRISKELELFEQHKVSQVFVLDPTFNRDAGRAKKILKLIGKTAPLIHFTFEARTEFIDAEMAELFASLNCSLQIGLQSAIPEVLANLNRKIDPEKFAGKISLLNEAGAIFGLDLIYGLPGDTPEGFRYSLDYAISLQPNHLDIFPLAVLPGTVLYDDANSLNLNFLKYPPYALISSPGFSEKDIAGLQKMKDACDTFYNRGGAAGWLFMALETLDIVPSVFLQSFSEFISPEKQRDLSSAEITSIQIRFVREQFVKYNRPELFPVMEDIITIHGAMNSSLYAGPYSGSINPGFNQESVFRLSPGTFLAILKFSYDDLMTVGEYDFEEFLAQYRPQKTNIIFYNRGGEIKPLVVDKNIFRLIRSFDGKQKLKDILKNSPAPGRDGIHEFIEYALSETIITSV